MTETNTIKNASYISNTRKETILNKYSDEVLSECYDTDDASYLLFNKNGYKLWLITIYNDDYDDAYPSMIDLISDLVRNADYGIKAIAEELGIEPEDVFALATHEDYSDRLRRIVNRNAVYLEDVYNPY